MYKLASLSPQDQKQALGAHLFPQVEAIQPDLAGKITGMLLEMDNRDLLLLLEDPDDLLWKVQGAVEALWAHNAIPAAARVKEVDVESWLPPWQRWLVTQRQLALLGAATRRSLLRERLFYHVYQLQPLFACNITNRLLCCLQCGHRPLLA